MPEALPAVTPGNQTSEWTLTKIALISGSVLEGAAVAIHSAQAGGVNASWFAGALAVIGVVLQTVTFFGYTKGRSLVKAAALEADAVAKAGSP